MLDALDATANIIGVCESQYINNETIKNRLANGEITDVGDATAPNIEKLIALKTEVIIASPFNNSGYGGVEKTGIPVIECGDYMETDPLGTAEWLKFLALFTDREAKADTLFNQTKENYNNLKNQIKQIGARPRLLTGMKYGSTWYVPAGDSYMARLYRDAGADYIFSYLQGSGGAPLNFEAVLDKAIHADVWLILYNRRDDLTYAALQDDYAPYSRFDAFNNRHIYGCNAAYSLYHEEIPIRPDYLLQEIAALLHPEVFNEQTKYFRALELK
jgi:iron complex transport system substrate-binding protein